MTLEQKIKSEWLKRADTLRNHLAFMESEKQIKKSKAEYAGISYDNSGSGGGSSNTTQKKYDDVAKCDEDIAELRKLLERIEKEIQSAIDTIPDKTQREILTKHYTEHKPIKIISKEMHYSVSSIKKKHLQALSSLKIDHWTY